MAAPAPNSAAALGTTNPFGSEHSVGACVDDPNFATICSFIEQFGDIVRIGQMPFDDLQHMLENTADVPLPLVQLHITLLRRVFKTVTPDKWERSLAKFGHTYCSQDAWEIERFGYKKAKIQTKLRLLKNLLEAQFDYNVKFKAEVNKLQAADLRLAPLGRDTEGQVYWYQVDADANLRVYREDIDDETWEIVASSRDELEDLISQLQRGEVKKPEPEEAIIVPEEDSNGKDIEPKEIILDTGKVEEGESTGDESEESENEMEDDKEEVKLVEPLLMKNLYAKQCTNSKQSEREHMDVDESEPKVQCKAVESTSKSGPGFKFVLGVKSKPKLEAFSPKQEVLKDVIESSVPVGSNEETVSDKLGAIDTSESIETSTPTLSAKPADVIAEVSEPENHSTPKFREDPTPQITINDTIIESVDSGDAVSLNVDTLNSASAAKPKSPEPIQNTVGNIQISSEQKIHLISEKLIEERFKETSPEEKVHLITDKPVEDRQKEISPEKKIHLITNKLVEDRSKEVSPEKKIHLITDKLVEDRSKEVSPEKKIHLITDKLVEEKERSKEISPEGKIHLITDKLVKERSEKIVQARDKLKLKDSSAKSTEITKSNAKEPSDDIMEMSTEELEQKVNDNPSEINISLPPAVSENTQLQPTKHQECEIKNDSGDVVHNVSNVNIIKISEVDVKVESNADLGIAIPSDVNNGDNATEPCKAKDSSSSEQTFQQMSESDNKIVESNIISEKVHSVSTKLCEGAIVAPVSITQNLSSLNVCGENSSQSKSEGSTVTSHVEEDPKSDIINEGKLSKDASIPTTDNDKTPLKLEAEAEISEEQITKSTTWICGDSVVNEEKEVIHETITKEQTWVCGSSNSGEKLDNVKPHDMESILSSATEVACKPDTETCKEEISFKDNISLEVPDQSPSLDLSCSGSAQPNKPNSSLVLYSESSEDGSEDAAPVVPTSRKSETEKGVPSSSHQTKSTNKDKEEKDNSSTKKAESDTEKSSSRKEELIDNGPSLDSHTEVPANEPTDNPKIKEEEAKTDISSDSAAVIDLKETATEPGSAILSEKDLSLRSFSEISQPQLVGSKSPASFKDGGGKLSEMPLIESGHLTGISDSAKITTGPSAKESPEPTDTESSSKHSNFSANSSTGVPGITDSSSKYTENSDKRKADEDISLSYKMPRLDLPESKDDLSTQPPFNPIVGEAIEEEIMTVIGEGSGALNEGSNENSPAALAADVPGSHDESIESECSRDAFPTRGRGGRRGRGRRGRPSGMPSASRSTPKSPSKSASRGLREVAGLGVSVDALEVNGDRENDRPVRASRRIAQIRLKEEEERRKQEEERLAQLKAAQLKKKAKQEKEKSIDGTSPQKGVSVKAKKALGKKASKEVDYQVKDYVPSGSESEDNSDEEDASDDYSGKGGKKKHKPRKNGKAKKGGNPWATSSEEDEEAVEEEEEYHYEEEEEELVFKSDHEFSPESDLGEDSDAGPSRHARTAKQDKGDKFEEGNCCRCGRGDHPEWILLCDKCDKGWHASCLRPQLWVVPEGEWFCPPCQHNMLIENLTKNLGEYEGLLKRRENEILRKQRLAYVGISLNNVLPDKEKPETEEIEQIEEKSYERKKPRRRILSDEDDELSGDFINDSDDDLSKSRSNSSDSEDEPVYRLRARRSKKAFDFKEYDDMINSALRVDDDEEEEIEKGDDEPQEDADDENEESEKINGDEGEVHSGKNEAYLQHLEKQAQEEDETDEELLDEKERLRRRELNKSSHKKTKRRINDLDEYSEEDSDDDFKASEAEDEEELAEEGESEWSGEKGEEDSDDSIAKRARRKDRHGHRRLGRREKYSDKGLVRRSTRKRKSRISYDESDEEDDEEEEDQNDKWQSNEETEESESNSESDDATWGKRKKKAFAVSKPKMPSFPLGASSSTKGKGKGGVKRKKRKTDDDDVDRAWNNARGGKQRDEPVERRTRGRKINFKVILDSGESDDDGNVRPKRRPLSDSDEDSRSPSSSRKLAEEIRAENARRAKEYEETQTKSRDGITNDDEAEKSTASENSVKIPIPVEADENNVVSSPLVAPLTLGNQLASILSSPSPVSKPVVSSPMSLSLNSSPLPIISNMSPLPVPQVSSKLVVPPKSSTPPVAIMSPNSGPPILSSPPPPVHVPPTITPPPNLKGAKTPPPIPYLISNAPLNLQSGLALKGLPNIPPPVPVSTPEKKSSKQSKGSRGSRGSSKADKRAPVDLEYAVSKSVPKTQAVSSVPSKSSSKKRESASINIPNPNLLMAGGNISEILSQTMGLPSALLAGAQALTGSSTHSSSKKGSSGNNALNQHGKGSGIPGLPRAPNSSQQTPPPVSQNLSPSLPIDIDRVPNPALFQGNPGIRPFHPMWVRNPGPPLPAYSTAGSQGSASLGKPPPLNTSPFSGQQGPPSRPGFSSPPPLRIPNPNTSPLQAFQHFKRDSPLAGPLYRLVTGQPQPGVPLSNLLPPGMMPPHGAGPERFFGAPSAYGHPYGLLPPHTQGHPQPLFTSPYDYRPPEPPFKEEPAPPRTTSGSLPAPVSTSSSSPPPTTSTSAPSMTKEEASAARDSEFGGLVSYFSSQRSEEDMDT